MPPRRAEPSDDDPFSDSSSSYWPRGWSWVRYSDPDVDFSSLSEAEKDKMRNGLQDVLGDDGMRRMTLYLRQKRQELENKRLRDQGVPPPEYEAPGFLRQWKKRQSDGPWGFVAFRTTSYDDEVQWGEYKDRVRQMVSVAFDHVVEQHRGHEHEEVARARKSFELHWIEDKALDGATAGMEYSMFLCASAESIESVVSLDDGNLPTTKSPLWRADAPFLLVVMEQTEVNPHGVEEEDHDPKDPHDERSWYKSVFKVPVEIIPDQLWHLIDRASVQPTRLTRQVKGSTELGGTMPENHARDGLTDLWWGMAPSPKALARRRALRGV